jgi:hypothetical protein
VGQKPHQRDLVSSIFMFEPPKSGLIAYWGGPDVKRSVTVRRAPEVEK